MKTAIAIIKSGRSFDEAAKVTGLSVESIMKEWQALTKEKTMKELLIYAMGGGAGDPPPPPPPPKPGDD